MTPSAVPGDPASCSDLGGTLRRESGRLRVHHERLVAALPQASTPAQRERLAAAAQATGEVLRSLDRGGGALQRFATDLAEAAELARRGRGDRATAVQGRARGVLQRTLVALTAGLADLPSGPPSDRKPPPSDRESPPSDRESPPSDRESPPSDREPLR